MVENVSILKTFTPYMIDKRNCLINAIFDRFVFMVWVVFGFKIVKSRVADASMSNDRCWKFILPNANDNRQPKLANLMRCSLN